jgi:hypothetical protein
MPKVSTKLGVESTEEWQKGKNVSRCRAQRENYENRERDAHAERTGHIIAMRTCNGVVGKKKQLGEDAIKLLRVIVGDVQLFPTRRGNSLRDQ